MDEWFNYKSNSCFKILKNKKINLKNFEAFVYNQKKI
jgi:hypothetical protein